MNASDHKKFKFLFPDKIDIKKAFENTPTPVDYVLPGLVAGTTGCIFSPGATGKSYLTLQGVMRIAAAAAGGDLLGLGVKSASRVIYLSLEDPEIITQNRLHAIGKHLNKSARELVHEGVEIVPLFGEGFDIMEDDHFMSLLNLCNTGEPPRLIIIDTLSRACALDLNDGVQARKFMRRIEFLAKETGAAVVYLHHVSKSSVRDGKQSDQIAAQGSAVLIDDARWGCAVSKMSENEAKGFSENDKNMRPVEDNRRAWFVKMSFPKPNYGPPLDDLWFERHEGGVLLPASLYPISAAASNSKAATAPKTNQYLEAKNGRAFGWNPT